MVHDGGFWVLSLPPVCRCDGPGAKKCERMQTRAEKLGAIRPTGAHGPRLATRARPRRGRWICDPHFCVAFMHFA
jgi:hypothetical protein